MVKSVHNNPAHQSSDAAALDPSNKEASQGIAASGHKVSAYSTVGGLTGNRGVDAVIGVALLALAFATVTAAAVAAVMLFPVAPHFSAVLLVGGAAAGAITFGFALDLLRVGMDRPKEAAPPKEMDQEKAPTAQAPRTFHKAPASETDQVFEKARDFRNARKQEITEYKKFLTQNGVSSKDADYILSNPQTKKIFIENMNDLNDKEKVEYAKDLKAFLADSASFRVEKTISEKEISVKDLTEKASNEERTIDLKHADKEYDFPVQFLRDGKRGYLINGRGILPDTEGEIKKIEDIEEKKFEDIAEKKQFEYQLQILKERGLLEDEKVITQVANVYNQALWADEIVEFTKNTNYRYMPQSLNVAESSGKSYSFNNLTIEGNQVNFTSKEVFKIVDLNNTQDGPVGYIEITIEAKDLMSPDAKVKFTHKTITELPDPATYKATA